MKKTKKYTLEELQEAMKNKQAFEAYIETVDAEYNLICLFAGNLGIIPREEVSCVVEDNGLVDPEFCLKKKGKIMQVCIQEIITKDGELEQVILSRKELELKVRRWMYMNLKPGMKLKGVVRGLTDYAAFVDVGGGVTGIVKIDEISAVRIQNPSTFEHIIADVVKKYDKDTGRIELSLKDAMGTFETKVKKLKEGDIVDGVVRSRSKSGMFIELPNKIEGLVRIEDLKDDYYTYDESTFSLIGNKNKRGYRLGDEVKVEGRQTITTLAWQLFKDTIFCCQSNAGYEVFLFRIYVDTQT